MVHQINDRFSPILGADFVCFCKLLIRKVLIMKFGRDPGTNQTGRPGNWTSQQSSLNERKSFIIGHTDQS